MNPTVFLSAILFILFVVNASLFTVDQRQTALVLQLGEIRSVIQEAGLHAKVPFIQNIRFFDRRILTLDTQEPERFITSEKKNVKVDSFVKWRIVDPKRFYTSFSGKERLAEQRLHQTINAGLREEFGKRTLHDVISGEREHIMKYMREKADQEARRYGVEIVDVRLRRIDYPQEISDKVFDRMRSERVRVANEARSTGAAEAEKIRANADREREVMLATAYRDAQKLMGEGDAKAAAIYAEAFGRNPEFYAFYRSLDAYRSSFKNKTDLLVVDPSSEFFKYFKHAQPVGMSMTK